LFGQGAQVNIGGLVASTLNLNDATLNSNTRTFGTPPPQAGEGQGSGSVTNQGTITAANGGYVALLGKTVSNQGTITANLGTVALGAGSAATLTFSGNNLVHLQVDQSTLNNLAENGGLIQADGGQVLMTAGAKNAVLASVVNNTGVIEARTVENHNGTIILLGGMAAGTVNVGGTLDASAPSSPVGAQFIARNNSNPSPDKSASYNGGFIETSAAHVKVAADAKVTTAAAQGLSGTWLIDPVDFTIAATGGDITGATLSSNLGSGNVVIQSSTGAAGTAGNVNINDVVSWSANKLTLNAQNNINIKANLNGAGTASLALEYGQGAALLGNTSNYFLNNGAQVNLPMGNNFSTKLGSNGVVKNFTVITDLTNLQGMQGSLTNNYVLGANIDASATVNTVFFSPIGNATTPYTGTFDGLGHSVTNLNIYYSGISYVGMFGDIKTGAVIRNVSLVGGSVTGSNYVGGLVGYNLGGTIDFSNSSSTVTGSTSVGGLVGYNKGGAIDSSYAQGKVNAGAIAYISNAGGLVGYNLGGIIDSSNSSATVYGTGNNIGGLVGNNDNNGTIISTIRNSFAMGSVSGGADVGGLVGFNSGGAINTSYATGIVNGTGSYVGGLVGNTTGNVSNTYATGNVTGSVTVGGLVGTSSGTIDNSYAQGTVNAGAIAYISNAGGLAGYSSGSVSNAYATGTVTVTGSGGHVGGLIGESHAGVSNSYATGSVSGGADVGGLVGFNSGGTINTSYATGIVNGTGSNVGGLVGNTTGNVSNTYATGNVTGSVTVGGLVGTSSGTIDNSYAQGTVNAGAIAYISNAGGLAGYSSGSVSNAYATGTVTGTGGHVGGLIGESHAGVSNSYAAGSVSGGYSDVGGLVGYNNGTTAQISNSYATGSVSGKLNAGGLVGLNTGGSVYSYWNITTSGQATSAGGTGLTTAQMQNASNFTGFTFTTTPGLIQNNWVIVDTDGTLNGSNGATFPMLASEYSTTINNTHQLQLMAMNLSANYTLRQNIDALGTGNSKDVWGNSIWGSSSFAPIGNVTTQFTGTFDGLGHTISNLTMNLPGVAYVGLFGYMGTGSVVGNVGLVGGSVTGSAFVGGLVGVNLQGTVTNSYDTGNVSGTDIFVGGLVGYNPNGTVNNSYATGSVSGKNYVGGLIGFNQGATSNSYATGSVSGANYVGGLVGYNDLYSAISNSYATGSVSGAGSYVGGLLGYNLGALSNSPGGTVNNSFATGSVSGTNYVGGLLGYNGSTVSNSFWDTITSNQPTVGVGFGDATGTTGLTTAQMKQKSSFSGWSIANTGGSGAIWRIYEGNSTPLLTSFLTPLTLTDAQDVAVTYNGTTQSAASTTVSGLLGTPLGTAANGTNAGFYNGYFSTQQGYDIIGGNLIISPKAVSETGLSVSPKTYDGTTIATVLGAPLLATETVGTGTTSDGLAYSGDVVNITGSATGTYNSKNVLNASSVTFGGLSLTGAQSANYTLVVQGNAAANITPAPLTATAAAPDKVYNGNASAAPVLSITAGLLSGETVTATGTGTFNSKDVLSANTVTVNSTQLADGTNGLASNYSLIAGETATAHITPAILSLSGTRAYDGSSTFVSSTFGTAGSINTGIGAENLSVSGSANAPSPNVTAGIQPLTLNTLSLNDGTGLASNYTLTGGTQTGQVTPKTLTAIITSSDKIYDGNTTAASSLTINGGLISGETVTASGSATFNSKDVLAANTVTVNSVQLADGINGLASNYSLDIGEVTTAHITAAPLTATVVTSDKIYDGNTTVTPKLMIATGLVSGETLTATGTGTFNSKDVLTANSVTVNSTALIDGVNGLASNYSLTAGQTATAHISPAVISLAGSRIYDGSTTFASSAFGTAGSITTGIGTENLSVSGSAIVSNPNVIAGAQSLTSSTLALNDGTGSLSNYTLTGGTHTGQVTPKALTATVTAPGKIYNGNTTATPVLSIISGMVSGETVTATGTGAFNSKDALTANTVTVNSTQLVDGNNGLASNYSLASGETTTAHITPFVVSLTGSRTYDGSVNITASALTFGKLVGSESLILTGNGTVASKNVGTGKTLTLDTLALSNGLNGGIASNYTFTGGNQTIDITQLASVAWAGGSTGNWSNASNWAGGAIPDGVNVAAVSIPSNVAVTYDSGVVGATTLSMLSSSGNFTMSAGTLSTVGNFSTAGYQQTGGTLNVGGNMTVTQNFAKAAGATGNLVMAGGNITQITGDLVINDGISWSANKLTLNAQNNININANLNGSGTASLALQYGQVTVAVGNASDYFLNNGAQVNLPAGPNFTTKLGSNGVVKNYTVITNLGASYSYTTTDLQGMEGNLAANYVLGANIDAATTITSGFTPVGSATTPFSGTFDGLGHSILNLNAYWFGAANNIGLFGYTNTGSIIQNIGLVGAYVTGVTNVGGLVGYSKGVIRNSYVTGNVAGTGNNVGGLVGYTSNTISNSYATSGVSGSAWVGGLVGQTTGSISTSYATGNVASSATFVNSVNGFVGGLVGYSTAAISDSYASGSVNGINQATGGLAGYISNTVSNSYATGDVTGAGNVGGLAGTNLGGTFINSHAMGIVYGSSSNVGGLVGYSTGSISNSYATNSVTGSAWVGGLVGQTTSSISASYATGNVASNAAFVNSVNGFVGGLVGYSTAAISDSFASGSVTGINQATGGLAGYISNSVSNSYATGDVTGAGNVGGLAGTNLGGTIINSHATGIVTGTSTYVGGLVGASTGSISGSYATGNVNGTSYTGGLAGSSVGTTSVNVTINNSFATGNVVGTTFVGGLAGYVNYNATSQSYATGNVTGISAPLVTTGYVGGLVGYAIGAAISDSYATGAVTGVNGNIGGLVGFSANVVNSTTPGQIINSYATGVVSGSNNIGGLVGYNYGATVSNSHASGNVTATGSQVGGLVGNSANRNYAITSISDSYATGDVVGTSSVGGLVGRDTNNSSVTRSYAKGNVTGLSTGAVITIGYVGGLVGYAQGVFISDSYASGSLTGANGSTGGLVGYLINLNTAASEIYNSYATGIVKGSVYVGGLVGTNTSSLISNSYASGAVTGTTVSTGGLVGSNVVGSVGNSFWDITTSGQATSAGGVGLNTAQMQSQANFTSATSANNNVNPAWDFANTWVMYDGHTYPLLRSFMSPLTVTANTAIKTYDGQIYSNANGVSYSVPSNGNLFGTVNFTTDNPLGDINVGSYTITPAGLYSNQQGYIISYASGNLTVNPAQLSASIIGNPNKIYDGNTIGTLNSFNYSLSGFVTGEGATVNQTVGSYNNLNVLSANAINVTLATPDFTANSGTLLSNYILPTNATGAGNISPAPLTASAAAPDKVYNGNTTAAPTLGIVSGLVSGETVTAIGAGTFNSKDVLTANTVTVNSVQLADGINGLASNYSLATGETATAHITPAPLTATATASDKIYNGNTAASPTLSITGGLVNGETVTATGTGTFNSKDVLTANTVTVNSTQLADGTNGLGSNYSLANGETTTAHITPAVLSLAGTRAYDAGNNFAASTFGTSGTITTGVGTENLSVSGVGIVPSANVIAGSQTLTLNTLMLNDGAGLASNYTLKGGTSTGQVTPKALTGMASAPDKVYDGNTTAAPVLSITAGLVNGESVTAIGTGTFNSKDVLTADTVTVKSTQLVDGTSGLASNYSLTAGQTATAHISPAELTVTADSASKTYGQAIPTLSGSVTGFVGSDTLANATGGTEIFSAAATGSTDAGSSAITGSGLTANYGNYVFAQAAGNAAALTINPASLTVTALNAAMSAGTQNPVLMANYLGFVNGDSAASLTAPAAISTTANVASGAGNYPINVSGASSPNYTITYVNGNLKVMPSFQPNIAANAVEKYPAISHESVLPPIANAANELSAKLIAQSSQVADSLVHDVNPVTQLSYSGRGLLTVVDGGIKLPGGL
jgi:hypothetical protein